MERWGARHGTLGSFGASPSAVDRLHWFVNELGFTPRETGAPVRRWDRASKRRRRAGGAATNVCPKTSTSGDKIDEVSLQTGITHLTGASSCRLLGLFTSADPAATAVGQVSAFRALPVSRRTGDRSARRPRITSGSWGPGRRSGLLSVVSPGDSSRRLHVDLAEVKAVRSSEPRFAPVRRGSSPGASPPPSGSPATRPSRAALGWPRAWLSDSLRCWPYRPMRYSRPNCL